MGIPPTERRRRMLENITALRHLWTNDEAAFEGAFLRFSGITLERSRCAITCPIWLTTNAGRLANGQADAGGSRVALRRVERLRTAG